MAIDGEHGISIYGQNKIVTGFQKIQDCRAAYA